MSSSNSVPYWVTVFSLILTSVISITALVLSNRQFKNTINSKKEEVERNEIHTKLNEFYGPLFQLRKKNNLLFKIFSEKYIKKDSNFRTLAYLLNGVKFQGNDSVLLNEIVGIDDQCEKLIHEKAGLIDDSLLRNVVIPRTTTHFLLIRLAHKGALQRNDSMFEKYVFPRELDSLLEKRRKELEMRLVELNRIED